MFFAWKVEVKARGFGKEFSVDEVSWVNPERIEYFTPDSFYIYDDKGKIIGGNWDRLEKKFEELDVYRAFTARFIDGKDWKDTAFYHRVLNEISRGRVMWGCKTKSEFDERCKQLESLFQHIKKKGYKSQNELPVKEDAYPMSIEDEITVNVGRHGDLLFNQGRHRLSIAKLLRIPKVPIRITVRHPQWQKFREEVLWYASRHGGKIYQPITHPDLSNIPSTQDSEYIFNIIKENLSVQKGRLLDIGAHWGYFCHKFEEEGFDCYAVENDLRHIHFLQKLKRAENRNFKIIRQSIFEYKGVRNLSFDVVLALNIFHHFLKKRTTYSKFIDLLRNLKMKEMFFQPHLPDEPQMIGAYKNYTNKEFVRVILQNSQLDEAKLIGVAEKGRPLYKLC